MFYYYNAESGCDKIGAWFSPINLRLPVVFLRRRDTQHNDNQ
jgi:hypothetical protein